MDASLGDVLDTTPPPSSATAALPKLRSHAFHAPTGEDLTQLLSDAGVEDAVDIWRRTCADLEVSTDPATLSLAELERVIRALVAGGGVVGLLARAVGIRAAAYREIAARDQAAAPLPWDWARRALDELLLERVPLRARLQEILDLDPFAPELGPDLHQAATRLALGTGAALGSVTVMLEGAQAVVGQHQFPEWAVRVGGVPLEWTFCFAIVRDGTAHTVPDATTDVMHRVNPVVVHEGIASYAGVPLISSRGQVIGTCCVMDVQPRPFTEEDLQVLRQEADAIVDLLERRRAARDARRSA